MGMLCCVLPPGAVWCCVVFKREYMVGNAVCYSIVLCGAARGSIWVGNVVCYSLMLCGATRGSTVPRVHQNIREACDGEATE